MRVPLSWLREYVRVDADAARIADALSVSTAEVNTIERRGPADTELFVVGRVLTADKHPNADRLQLCQVDVGEGKPAQIVCGAWNFGAGATVAVARPGATLPNGLTLERRELRGEMSEGMILAEDEIDLGTDHSGIMLLAGRPRAGLAARRRAAARRGDPRRRAHRQPRRSPLRLRHRARGCRAPRRRAAADARHRSGAGRRRAARHPDRGPRRLPALRRPALPRRDDRRVAASGCRLGSATPASARSPTSSTSRTTSCSRSATRCTPSTSTRSTAGASSCAARRRGRSCGRSTAQRAS